MGRKRPRKKPTSEPLHTNQQESGQSEQEQQPKRKRGRPRKLVVVVGVEKDQREVGGEENGDGEMMNLKSGKQEEGTEPIAPADVGLIGNGGEKKEMPSEEDNKPKSRGRRKGKPCKSA